ncbi:reverse transcriptase-like protein [Falsibacillus albus]|uniref:Reverse transcriptase-like protein n=1 Tax=Falsibacillus albus TaxID=2478915 RepID=A0A3L7K375_9BACI|nr:reverse transcriptase-like protein [Falsibacillus albus]RLQ95162.1 reverse transcriptase-like protein [Falsibacillus albus]
MIEVYIDGASAGDPGPSGAGIFINNNGNVERYQYFLGEMNNHEAEYIALLKGIEICLEKGYRIVSFRTDSKAVVSAMEKEFVKKEKYKVIFSQALELSRQFDLFFIKWVPSKENRADELARNAILHERDGKCK